MMATLSAAKFEAEPRYQADHIRKSDIAEIAMSKFFQ